MKKMVLLQQKLSSQVVSKVLSVLLATTTHEGVSEETVDWVLTASRQRITKWIADIMNGKEFGGNGFRTKVELEVCRYIIGLE